MAKQPKRFAWLATELADRGYQQRDLAKAWGIDDAVITRFIATGKPDLTPERMIALARMLEMDYNELMVRMYEDVAPRRPSRVAVSPMPAPARVENVSPELKRLMDELYEVAERVRKIMPGMEVNVTFSCRGRE